MTPKAELPEPQVRSNDAMERATTEADCQLRIEFKLGPRQTHSLFRSGRLHPTTGAIPIALLICLSHERDFNFLSM